MKVYVLYVLADYAVPYYMSIDKRLCEQARLKYIQNTRNTDAWIEEYDFSQEKGFELDPQRFWRLTKRND